MSEGASETNKHKVSTRIIRAVPNPPAALRYLLSGPDENLAERGAWVPQRLGTRKQSLFANK